MWGDKKRGGGGTGGRLMILNLTHTLSHKKTASAPSVVRQIDMGSWEYGVKGCILLGME